MRTPNIVCLLCQKPLYRRPSDMKRSRYAACMGCRSEAQKLAGITEAQQAGLRLGRPKGTNHRAGYKHKPESRAKASVSHKAFCAAHPELVAARSAKTRGEKHRLWKGGITQLNQSIRQMTENRKWMDAVKARDGRCLRCGSTEKLESHHLKSLASIIEKFGIRSRDDARRCSLLWDVTNGETICEPCHYAEHGRRLAA